jgi:hypothetical protein
MLFSHKALLLGLALLGCSLSLSLVGCGGKPETAASPDELDAFLQANPDIADEEAPEIETE